MKRLFVITFAISMLSGCMTINTGPKIEPLVVQKIKEGTANSKIAVIRIDGIISDMPRRSFMGEEIEVSMPVRLREELDLISHDPDVRAVLLRIDSPGGGVSTCDIMYNEIMKFKKERKIPVVVEMVGVAASGGVYLAVAGDYIIAQPTTVTGSIGVIAQMTRFKELLDKIGIASEVIKSGDKKDMGSPFRTMTDEERSLYQELITGMYERFLSVILAGRKNLDEKKLRLFADGRVFTSKKALEYGLIDSIGYTDDALAQAEKLAGIKNATVISYSRPGKYTPNIFSGAMPQSSVNILNLDSSIIEESLGCRFMFLMQ